MGKIIHTKEFETSVAYKQTKTRKMNDLEICMGTGDYPTGGNISDEITNGWNPSQEEILEMQRKGLVQDSTGSWFDPNNYMDRYSMDW